MSNNQQGWIKIHRGLMDKGWFCKPEAVSLWLCLLMEASHSEKEVYWNGRTTILKPGQFITGRKSLSEKTGIAQTTIERWLNVFESEQQIGQQKTSTSRLISVLNWSQYQERGQMSGQRTDNEWTADGQRTDTIRRIKERKELKNIPPTSSKTNSDYFEASKDDQLWVESLMMTTGIRSIDQAKSIIREFYLEIQATEEVHATIRLWRQHCVRWIKKRPPKAPESHQAPVVDITKYKTA